MMMLGLDAARKIAAAVQRRAVELDKPMTVVVVDSGGFTVLAERMDGARPLTPSIATAKAYTAAVMQRPTKMLRTWAGNDPAFFAQVSRMGHHPIVATLGGITIKRDGVIVGGLGISGGTGEEDEELAVASLAELGYELDFQGFNPVPR
jgi:uncharacterized protein GlcG (DUF336 family)